MLKLTALRAQRYRKKEREERQSRNKNHMQCREVSQLHHDMSIVSSVQFLVTRSIEMQCEHLCKFIAFSLLLIPDNFVTAQTALYHCTIASYHCKLCVSLHSILCLGSDQSHIFERVVPTGPIYALAPTILDLLSAFDCIDHALLLQQLGHNFTSVV